MKSGLRFLAAAKRCEIADLQQLALTSALVGQCAQLIHELQRERGLSNLYLGSGGGRFGGARGAQLQATDRSVDELRAAFERLDTHPRAVAHGARLFSRIAYALQGLDALPALREQVLQQAWNAERATAAYVRLIAALLAVVFEAADRASDPEVSRLLVALFNFMQGKEFTGQERACGAALFASGHADAARQQRLLHLIESQERCLQVFTEFTGGRSAGATPAEVERLRRIACTTPPGAPLDTALSQPWFDANTQRIDAMKAQEDDLARELRQLCAQRTEAAQADLGRHLALAARLQTGTTDALDFFDDGGAPPPPATPGLGPGLERSILELVQAQSRRLQAMADELDTVRGSLNERKLIERAKGLLMAHRHLNEEEAHKTMRQMAMNQNRRLVDVAEAVLSMAEVLPLHPR